MRKTIFFKIFSGYLIIITLLSAGILFFSYRSIRNNYIDIVTNNLDKISGLSTSLLVPLLEKGRLREVRKKTEYIGRLTEYRITVIDIKGKVVADSEEDPQKMNNHINRPEIRQALKNGRGTSVRYSNTLKREMLYFAVSAGEKWILRVSVFLKDINNLTREISRSMLFIALVVILVSLAGAYVISRRISVPLRSLSEASRKIAARDFDVNVAGGDDEAGTMAESFNFMAREIKELFTMLSAQKEELNTIISSISEGLLLVDKDGKAALNNGSFEKIAGRECKGRFYWECMLPAGLNSLIEKSIKEKKNVAGQVEINGKTFLCSITYLEAGSEQVVMLHDVTGIKEFENIKKDFVANVSHELKTPLTSIKGFTETLEGELADADNLHYLEIIKRNTERLISIVEDLLLLSNLEKKGGEEEFENVNAAEIIRRCIKIFEQKIRKKKLELKTELDDASVIKGDAFKLEQMLINLIDNAVKYTDEGKIVISAVKGENNVFITVEDTGIGIPENSIERIFERFYVTDKSRSRKMGGTGLGLSIVKHIVLLHKGEIEVRSGAGRGTKFIITFPAVS